MGMQTRTDAAVTDDPAKRWWQDAECIRYAGRVDFFPARGESSAAAKAVCVRCDVRAECLEYALQWDPLCGVWGGLSERERRQLKQIGRAHV